RLRRRGARADGALPRPLRPRAADEGNRGHAAARGGGLVAGGACERAAVAVAVAGLLYRALLLPPWIYATSHRADVTPWRYLMTEWSAYLYYLRLFVWPDALVVDRLDYPFVA